MAMILEIVSTNGAALGDARIRRIQQQGVTIGRCSQRSDWVIDHADKSYVSRLHARVSFESGDFHVTGLGTNPIAVYHRSNVVPNECPCLLQLGDRFFVEDYEIEVVEVEPDRPTLNGASFTAIITAPEEMSQDVVAGSAAVAVSPRLPENVLDWIGANPEREKSPEVGTFDLQVATPPSMADASGQASRLSDSAVASRGIGSRSVSAMDEAGSAQLGPEQIRTLEDLLRAANVEPASVPQAVTDNCGKLILTSVQGLVDLLQGRSSVKYEGGVCGTRVMAVQNNPLKLSPNALAAIRTLLGQPDPAFLAPQLALEQAMDDLRHHQIIVINSMRTVFDMLLDSFEPQQLKARFAVRTRAGLRSMLEKARFHDLYVEHFASLKDNSEAIFKRYFAAAYEKQENAMRSAANAREVGVGSQSAPLTKDRVAL